jgi:hypothetical protein
MEHWFNAWGFGWCIAITVYVLLWLILCIRALRREKANYWFLCLGGPDVARYCGQWHYLRPRDLGPDYDYVVEPGCAPRTAN